MKVNELFEAKNLGSKVAYSSFVSWKTDLPGKSTFHKDGSLERAQALGKDFEGVAGTFDHRKGTGWIYEYYLDKKNLVEGWERDLANANKERAKKEAEAKKAIEKANKKMSNAELAKQRKEEMAAYNADLLARIAQMISIEASNTLPDVDPFDRIVKKLDRMGINENDYMTVLNRAAKKHLQCKSYDDYLANFIKEYEADNKFGKEEE